MPAWARAARLGDYQFGDVLSSQVKDARRGAVLTRPMPSKVHRHALLPARSPAPPTAVGRRVRGGPAAPAGAPVFSTSW